MTWLRRTLRRLRGVVARTGETAVREELQVHLDLLADEYRAQGLSDRDARLRARRDLGNIASLAERTRAVATYPGIEAAWQDARHAVVGLRRTPGFTAAAVVTLALAIGATTAVYSLVYGVLLRPLPFVEPDTLVRLWEEHPGGNTIAGQRWLSHWTYHAWAGHEQTLSGVGGYTTWTRSIRVGDQTFPAGGASLTPSLVGMLGARPTIGRWFTAADAAPGAPPVVVLSHRLWQERFGSRTDALGRSILIDEEPVTVIGVAAPGLRFPTDRADCWRPYAVPTPAAEPRRTMGFNAIGRLAFAATPAAVEAEGTTVARRVERPLSATVVFGTGGPVVVHARPLAEDVAATVRPALLALTVAVALVMLVACANVANLLLSRGAARQRELAVRLAIGASRARLVRLALTESLVLAVGGGVLGMALAVALVRVLPAVAPAHFPRLEDVHLDVNVLVAAVLVTLAAALFSGGLPSVKSAAVDAVAALRSGEGGASDGFRTRGARRVRDGLVIFESALAVILLVGALLVGHSLVRLMNVDAGYTAESVVTATFSMPRGSPSERGAAFVDEILLRLGARPDVGAIGAANSMPMVPTTAMTSFPIVRSPGAGEVMTRAVTYVVTPGYAEAIGLRLEDGRFFVPSDQRPGVRAVVVNNEFARRYLAAPVVGRRFARLYAKEEPVLTEIVGVVRNVLKDGHDRAAEPEIYFVHGGPTRSLDGYFSVAVRTIGAPDRVVSALRASAADIDAGALVERVDLLSDRVAASMAQPRFTTTVMGLMAGLGLSIASMGLFAVLSYTVTQRRRELGVRAALGASRWRLLSLVLGRGLCVSGIGLVIGLAVAAGLSQVLEGILFGVTPLDVVSFALAPLVLLPAVIAASLVPALRAAATDPAVVLRGE